MMNIYGQNDESVKGGTGGFSLFEYDRATKGIEILVPNKDKYDDQSDGA